MTGTSLELNLDGTENVSTYYNQEVGTSVRQVGTLVFQQ